MTTEQNTIRYAVVHIMNFILMELLRHGFKLAMENELIDLKGLVDTEMENWLVCKNDELVFIDDELLLLDKVEDPVVQQVMTSMIRVMKCKDTFLNLSGIDLLEVLDDEESYELATEVFYTHAFDLGDDGTYQGILEGLHSFYWPIDMILFHCALLVSMGEDLAQELVEKHYFSLCGQLGHELPDSNSYTDLLLELKEELNEDGNLVDGFVYGRDTG